MKRWFARRRCCAGWGNLACLAHATPGQTPGSPRSRLRAEDLGELGVGEHRAGLEFEDLSSVALL